MSYLDWGLAIAVGVTLTLAVYYHWRVRQLKGAVLLIAGRGVTALAKRGVPTAKAIQLVCPELASAVAARGHS